MDDKKNEFDCNSTMDTRSSNKRRSSLKKPRKSRNPLGTLDVTEINPDVTLAPPPRRVSFASSNFVKPFIDDPERVTIWDNTYEEEVNHTDSTKSENTNCGLSGEVKSIYLESQNTIHCQSVHNHYSMELIYNDVENPPKVQTINPNAARQKGVNFNQSMVDMEFTCQNDNMTVRNLSQSNESDMEFTCLVPNHFMFKNETQNLEQLSDMEFTCQWKNNILESRLEKEQIIDKENVFKNVSLNMSNKENHEKTVCFNQSKNDMEFTCQFQPKIVTRSNQEECIRKSNLKNFTVTQSSSGNSKSRQILCDEETDALLNQSSNGMEFTCQFQPKIETRANQEEWIKETNLLSLQTITESSRDQPNQKEVNHVNETYIGEEECSLIDTLPSLNEDELQNLSTYYNQKKQVDKNDLINKNTDFLNSSKEVEPVLKNISKSQGSKVIYSEPMKIPNLRTPILDLSDGFSSMHNSRHQFNFNNSLEDTQQLIQATFSKSSHQKTDQSLSLKHQSGCNMEPDISEVRVDVASSPQSDTLLAESIWKNIPTKTVKFMLPPIDYERTEESLHRQEEIANRKELLLSRFRLPELKAINLTEESHKRKSFNNTSIAANISDSISETEFAEDWSIEMEPSKTLHEQIVDVCLRSNEVLKIKYHEEIQYLFTTLFDNLYIYVEIHAEDGRVVEISTHSCLKDSINQMNHFILKHVCQKLAQGTLKSFLGAYYDILSLLDYICITVEESVNFQYEFFLLQREYITLKLHADFSISFKILHTNPPIYWTIQLNMLFLNKVQHEPLCVESKYGKINEEHIKTILRNIEEGPTCLRNIIVDVKEYFKRTQLKFRNM